MTAARIGQTESEYNPLALRYSEELSEKIVKYRDIPREIVEGIERYISSKEHAWKLEIFNEEAWHYCDIDNTAIQHCLPNLTLFQLQNYNARHGAKLACRIIEIYFYVFNKNNEMHKLFDPTLQRYKRNWELTREQLSGTQSTSDTSSLPA